MFKTPGKTPKSNHPILSRPSTPYTIPKTCIKPKSVPIQQQQHLLFHDSHSVVCIGELPLTLLDIYSHENMTAPQVDLQSGNIVFATSNVFYIYNLKRGNVLSFPISSSSTSSTISQKSNIGLCNLYNHGQSQGLLGCNTQGYFKYWENIHLGPLNYISCQVQLKPDEFVLKLIPISGHPLFLFITNKSLYKLSLSTSIQVGLLEKPSSILSRFNPFSTQKQDYGDFVTMFSVDREVYVVTQTSLQRWTIHKNATDRFIDEILLQDLLFKSISRDLSGSFSNIFNLEIQVQDAVLYRNQFILLTRFHVDSQESYYILVFIELEPELMIVDKKQLSFKHDARNVESPKLAIQDDLIFCFFTNSILLTCIDLEVEFEKVVNLQDFENSILGFGFYPCSVTGSNHGSVTGPVTGSTAGSMSGGNEIEMKKLLIIYSQFQTGLLQLNIHSNYIASLKSSPPTTTLGKQGKDQENLLYVLEQALFFATESNPLAFDLQNMSGDWDTACLFLSESILTCQSKQILLILDLKTLLITRLNKMELLMSLASDKLSKETRLILCRNAEKMAISFGLWQEQDALLEEVHSNPNPRDDPTFKEKDNSNLLTRSILLYMKDKHGSDVSQDDIKDFYKFESSHVLGLIEYIQQPCLDCAYKSIEYVEKVVESSRLILNMFHFALEYKREYALVYGLYEDAITIQGLILSLGEGDADEQGQETLHQVIEQLSCQFDWILETLKEFPFPSSSSVSSSRATYVGLESVQVQEMQSQLRNQVCQLADLLLGAYPSLELQGQEIPSTEKDKWIYPLVSHGRRLEAYRLAEKYNNFQVLVHLCIQDNVSKSSRLKDYISRYKYDFCQVLFSILLEKKMYKELLSDFPSEYLDIFLSSANVPWLAWIQDLACYRFSQAAANLEFVYQSEPILEKQDLAIRLSKLCLVAHSNQVSMSGVGAGSGAESGLDDKLKERERDLTMEGMEGIMDEKIIEYEKQMEYLSLQKEMSSLLLKSISSNDSTLPVNQIMNTFYSQVATSHPIQALICSWHLRKLLDGRALLPVEMIDLLTLVNSAIKFESDYYQTAIELLFRYLRNSRLFDIVCNRIWTRAYLKTDWKSLYLASKRMSDSELKKKLMDSRVYTLLKAIMVEDERGEVSCLENLKKSPKQVSVLLDLTFLANEYPFLSSDQLTSLLQEYEDDQERVQEYVENYGLENFFLESVRLSLL